MASFKHRHFSQDLILTVVLCMWLIRLVTKILKSYRKRTVALKAGNRSNNNIHYNLGLSCYHGKALASWAIG